MCSACRERFALPLSLPRSALAPAGECRADAPRPDPRSAHDELEPSSRPLHAQLAPSPEDGQNRRDVSYCHQQRWAGLPILQAQARAGRVMVSYTSSDCHHERRGRLARSPADRPRAGVIAVARPWPSGSEVRLITDRSHRLHHSGRACPGVSPGDGRNPVTLENGGGPLPCGLDTGNPCRYDGVWGGAVTEDPSFRQG
jgi:hypothetical protein